MEAGVDMIMLNCLDHNLQLSLQHNLNNVCFQVLRLSMCLLEWVHIMQMFCQAFVLSI